MLTESDRAMKIDGRGDGQDGCALTMNVFIKTLAGDLFSVPYPLDRAPGDLPFLVHDALRAQGLLVPVHHLRLIPEEEEEGEEGVKKDKVFHLLVEDPQLQVRIYFHDTAVLMTQEEEGHEDQDEWQENQEMEVYLLRVLRQEEILFEHYFYTPVAYVGTMDQPRKRYSNVFYHEDAVEVIYNPSFETRLQGAGSFREVDLRGGATAHYLPSAFALSCPTPAYAEVIGKEMDRVWMEHVRRTGESELYPIQRLYALSDSF